MSALGREESFAPTHSSRSSDWAGAQVWLCLPENRILASGKARFSASANKLANVKMTSPDVDDSTVACL
jgi:hypothetical protein